MSNIAIIPARGGSKRIPRKNIREFLGKPIIAYSIDVAKQSGLFDEVMVSTDDPEIADIAMGLGATVPFMRSNKNSNDFATTSDVIVEVLQCFNKTGRNFDCACCIYPTAPLITTSSIQRSFELLNSKKFSTVFPVVAFSYPIWRSLKITDGKAEMFWPENISKRSQDLPQAWHDAGQYYWLQIKSFLQDRRLFGINSGVIELQEWEAHDIDTEMDWKMAEIKAKMRDAK
jgi:pseudaminic acid cytidylyltransferase